LETNALPLNQIGVSNKIGEHRRTSKNVEEHLCTKEIGPSALSRITHAEAAGHKPAQNMFVGAWLQNQVLSMEKHAWIAQGWPSVTDRYQT